MNQIKAERGEQWQAAEGRFVCFPVDWAAAVAQVEESFYGSCTRGWREERGGNSRQRFSTQFHDGFREEAGQAFQVAEQREGSIVEESR